VLLVGVLVLGLVPGAVPGVERYAAQFTAHADYPAWVLHGARVALPVLEPSHVSADDYGYGIVSTLGACLAAAAGLFGRGVRESLPRLLYQPLASTVVHLRALHNGHIGDYIAWWSAGVSLVGGVCLIVLR
jgi:multicomponent Na+:H+ antiporter subunit D